MYAAHRLKITVAHRLQNTVAHRLNISATRRSIPRIPFKFPAPSYMNCRMPLISLVRGQQPNGHLGREVNFGKLYPTALNYSPFGLYPEHFSAPQSHQNTSLLLTQALFPVHTLDRLRRRPHHPPRCCFAASLVDTSDPLRRLHPPHRIDYTDTRIHLTGSVSRTTSPTTLGFLAAPPCPPTLSITLPAYLTTFGYRLSILLLLFYAILAGCYVTCFPSFSS